MINSDDDDDNNNDNKLLKFATRFFQSVIFRDVILILQEAPQGKFKLRRRQQLSSNKNDTNTTNFCTYD